MKDEVWVATVFKYAVSNKGRIMTLIYRDMPVRPAGSIIKLSYSDIYSRYTFRARRGEGVFITIDVGKLVATYFVENPHKKSKLMCIDGNYRNIEASNLKWVTEAELMASGFRIGKNGYRNNIGTGSSHYLSKLTDEQAINIKNAASVEDAGRMGVMYGIKDRNARKIFRGQAWKHLP
jgi:hypothetical protein